MNTKLYPAETLVTHPVPYWFSLKDPQEPYLIEDGNPGHRSQAALNYRNMYRIKTDTWPPGSPYFNAIENGWKMLKSALKNAVVWSKHRPHSAAELFTAAQDEWKVIPQRKLDLLVNSFPEQVKGWMHMEATPSGNFIIIKCIHFYLYWHSNKSPMYLVIFFAFLFVVGK